MLQHSTDPKPLRSPALRVRILPFVVVLLAVVPALAQLDQGQISGTVYDPSGAVVPGASVTATNTKMGDSRSVTSGSNGYFVITNLPVGPYQIRVEAPHFKAYVHDGLKLDAASRVAADAVLQLGERTEIAQVEASTVQLQLESAQIGRTVDSRQISELALNGRNAMNLPLMMAGVAGGDVNNFNPQSLNSFLTINGGSASSTAIVFDGVNAVRTRSGTAPLGVLNPDAMQEVQVLSASYNAEYGRSKDGQVRFVSKSGTKNFHGTAFEFVRNGALDANTWTRNNSPDPTNNSRPSPYRFNQPGFTVGGPVFIPGKWNNERNKLFFFVSEEWVRYGQSVTNTGTTPSAAMRKGDFSELLQGNNPFFNRVRTITDPLTGAPFPGNIIPAGRLSANGLALLNAFPMPTPGYHQGSSNWIASEPSPINSRADFIRADYYLGKHRIAFSGQNYAYEQVSPFSSSFDVVGTVQERPNRTGSVTLTSTLTPRLVNEGAFAAAEDIVRTNNNPADPYQRSKYGINYPYLFPGTKDVDDKIPTVAINGFSTLDGGPYPSWSTGPMYTFNDDLAWVANSRHMLKFGFSFEHAEQNNGDQIVISATTGGTNNQNGQFTFLDSGNPTTTGLAVANVALGNFNNYGEIGRRAYTLLRSNALEMYAQDTWHASTHLTVDFGIRISYFQPWYAKWNDIANFNPSYYDASQAAVVSTTDGHIISGNPYNGVVLPGSGFPSSANGRVAAQTVPNVKSLFHNLPRGFGNFDWKDAPAPRLGIAYALNPKTVIRAGAGIYRDRTLQSSTPLFGNPPNQLAATVTNGQVDNPGIIAGLTFPFQIRALGTNLRVPTSFTYTLSIQRQLPGSFLVDVAYVGKEGYHLFANTNLNQPVVGTLTSHPNVNVDALRPYRGLDVISQAAEIGVQSYQSFQLTVDRRFEHGLSIGLAYTFAKGIDNLSSPYNAYARVRAVSSGVRPNVLNINFVYELPVFRSQRGLGRVLGGWQISGVDEFRSGDWLSVTSSNDTAGVGTGSGSQPWNLVGNTTYGGATGVGRPWFNPAAFALPAPGTFGNAGLNILHGPGFLNLDTALFKSFRFGDKFGAQFRAEAFNFLNHPNLGNPNTNPTGGSFGYITSKSGNRNVQLGIKFLF
jgi:hypothetical protein